MRIYKVVGDEGNLMSGGSWAVAYYTDSNKAARRAQTEAKGKRWPRFYVEPVEVIE